MASSVCYYKDKEYSEGAVINVSGQMYQCGDLGTGRLSWIEYFGPHKLGQTAEPIEPKEKPTVVCLYAGLKYSEGAPLKMGDGRIWTCGSDGTWQPPKEK